MSKLTLRSVRRAIAIIEESRFSHLRAIYEPEREVTGSPAFHRKAVEEYEEVLDVLRQVATGLAARGN